MTAADIHKRREALKALEDLLLQCLSAEEEIRMWVAHNFRPEVAQALPAGNASRRWVAHEAVRLLESHDLLDEHCFATLAKKRERLRGEIEAVAQRCHETRGARAATLTAAQDPRRSGVHRAYAVHRNVLLCLFPLTVLTHCYPKLEISEPLIQIENAIFSFLPPPYPRKAPLFILCLTIALTAIFWLLARRNNRC